MATRDPNYWIKLHLLSRYGITADDWQALLDSQGGVCAVCRSPFVSAKQTHTDHDHKTGVVRGILCRGCNHALGHANDDAARLRALANYIEDHNG